jgi:hypothetical protein
VLDGSLQPKFVVETDFAWDTIDPGKLSSALDAGGSTSIKDAGNR